jgi:hypothetical protein
MDLTVERAVLGRMGNMGQSCVASKRFIAVESVGETFVEMFKEKLSGLRTGDPLDASTQVAPLSFAQAAARLEDQVKRSVAAGARILVGGKRPDPNGAFFEPTILTDVKRGMPAYDEERSKSPTTPDTGSAARSTRATSSAGDGSRRRSKPAWSSSTTPPTSTRTCRSAGSRSPVTVASAVSSASTSS